MKQTTFLQDRTRVLPRLATGYRKRSDGWHLGISGDQAIGASGVFSTLADLAKWDRNFYDKKLGGDAALRLMTEPASLKDGSVNTYTAGLEIRRYRGLTIFEHAGDGLGFQTTMLRFPEPGFSVAVLCNSRDQVSPTRLAQQVADLYLAGSLQPQEENRQLANAYDISEYKKFAGVYWDGKTDLLREISVKDGKLLQRLLPDDDPRELRYVSGRRFAAGNGITYEFAASGTTFTRSTPASGSAHYSRVPDSDLRTQDVAQFAGSFYSPSIDTHWQFAEVNHRLVLRRKGFPDEALEFEFRDAFLGDLGLFHFLRDRSGTVSRVEVMDYRLGSVTFTREAARRS